LNTDGKFDEEYYEGFMFSQGGLVCNLQENAGISAKSILLDNKSTLNVLCN